MIGKLTGTVAFLDLETIYVDVGGVGYRVYVPLASRPGELSEGDPISLFIHTRVREDAIVLHGFFSHEALEMFEQLLGVNGVGPRLAQAILASLKASDFRQAVATGDVARLTTVSGVGKKTAERIILELKGKVGEMIRVGGAEVSGLDTLERSLRDAYEALLALGYSQPEVKAALDKVVKTVPSQADSSEIVRRALKCI